MIFLKMQANAFNEMYDSLKLSKVIIQELGGKYASKVHERESVR